MSGGETDYLIFLLQTLKDEWKEHNKLKSGANREVKRLQTDLLKLEAFLRDEEKISEKSDLVKEKESEIRELVYDVEDTIEMYLTTTAAAKTMNFVSRLCINISTELEVKVKELREQRVQPILEEIKQKFGKSEVNGSTNSLEKQPPENKFNESKGQPSSPEDQKDKYLPHKIVDFQDEETILNSVLKSRETLDVIAITGTAGLGKTTFARKIYEHKDVVAQFPFRKWVHVSETVNSIDIFRKIWKSLTVKETFVKDEDLIDSVRRSLEKRKEKFLLVMDDVWTEKDWCVIQKILPGKNGSGKVLVTTRQIGVAELCSGARLPCHLKVLEPKKSLELLKFQVFDEPDQFDKELEEIGQDIADKCRGVPLMILVIGGILKKLYFEESRVIPAIKKKWSQVSKNLDEFIGKDENNLILDAVELSYKRLSHDLRLCFLYTGLFPENHEIPASTLTQLWIAEGFVAWKEGQSVEENADKILKTLIKMNLVEAAKKNLEQVKTCKVHDMVRVFCRTKAEKENLFRVIERPNEGPPPLNATVDFRRLCFDADPSGFLSNNLKSVRSFLWFSKGPVVESDAIQMSTVLAVSDLLRVLNCRSIRFKQFPEVKRLMLLKHITVFVEKLKYLPEEMSQLVNLQTLIVGTDSGFITVKANIWKMVRLRRLKTKAAILLGDKNWKGKHSGNLQTISRLSPESCKTALSKRAPNLKTLGVRGKLANVEKTMFLGDFSILAKLKLVNELDDESKHSTPLMVFTKLDWLPPNLKSLTLSNTCLQWSTHMPLLAKINSLEVLKLKANAFTGTIWDATKGWDAKDGAGFPHLEFLLMENLGLAFWKVPDTHFPNLTSLVIKNCEVLCEIPENLPKYLESLEIERVHSSAVASAKIIAQKQIILNQERPCEVAFKLTIDQVPFSVTINANSAASSSGQHN